MYLSRTSGFGGQNILELISAVFSMEKICDIHIFITKLSGIN